MRILIINGEQVDVDDRTSIGIDIQGYDFKKPGQSKVAVSNTFSIPATSKNKKIFGYPGELYIQDASIYNNMSIDYIIDNVKFIDKGSVRVESVQSGRINLFVVQSPDFFTQMKLTPLNYLILSYFSSIPSALPGADITNVATYLKNRTSGVKLSGYWGSFNGDVDNDLVDGRFYPEKYPVPNGRILGSENRDGPPTQYYSGGHISIYLKTLLSYLETLYDVNLHSGSSGVWNLFNDVEFNKTFMPVKNIGVRKTSGGSFELFWGEVPIKGFQSFEGLTVFDFINAVLQTFGCILEPMVFEGVDDPAIYDKSNSFSIVRFDSMKTSGWGGNLPGEMEADWHEKSKFMPFVEGFAQESYIKQTVADGISELTGAKKITSSNKNVAQIAELFKIKTLIPPTEIINNGGILRPILDTSIKESSKNFMFLQDNINYQISSIYYVLQGDGDGDAGVVNNYPAVAYSIENEYQMWDEIMQTPETRTVKRWVRSIELKNFVISAPYYVKELGGWYFVNKIRGFNPVESYKPVEFELIKLPWIRTPNL